MLVLALGLSLIVLVGPAPGSYCSVMEVRPKSRQIAGPKMALQRTGRGHCSGPAMGIIVSQLFLMAMKEIRPMIVS